MTKQRRSLRSLFASLVVFGGIGYEAGRVSLAPKGDNAPTDVRLTRAALEAGRETGGKLLNYLKDQAENVLENRR